MRIVDRDYPAVIPSDKAEKLLFKVPLTQEQRCVQGILVSGLTSGSTYPETYDSERAHELMDIGKYAPDGLMDGPTSTRESFFP